MTTSPGRRLIPSGSIVTPLAEAVARDGGRALLVGGWPRDQLLGRPSKDFDLEIFGLSPDRIGEILQPFGSSRPVGRQFPVWRIPREALDVSYPRAGALDYDPARPDSLGEAFRKAARHRDLTINAIGWDPVDGSWIDPWRGQEDLRARRLRLVDPETFGSDPLRLLRVARFVACLDFRPDEGLLASCRALDLGAVAAERVAGELQRILTEAERPSRAVEFLEETDRLEVLPPLAALRGVAQDPRWHPEGDVLVHTRMVIDCAAEIVRGLEGRERDLLMWSALCHDLGKPETTTEDGGRIRSLRHEEASARITRGWLDALRLPGRIVRAVETLVRHHLAPAQFPSSGARPRAYRRLARRLAAGDVTMIELERVARADQLGRTTEEARQGRFEAGERFLEAARAAGVESGPRPDVVEAADLMAAGISAGPVLGRALARCRELQDDRGWEDGERILAEIVREGFASETPPG